MSDSTILCPECTLSGGAHKKSCSRAPRLTNLRLFKGNVRAVDGKGMHVNAPVEVYLRSDVDAEIERLQAENSALRYQLIASNQTLAELRRAHEPSEKPGTVLKAFDVIREKMRDDPEYAWSWHCNIAVPIMDTAKVSHELANKAAAHLMQHLFAIDTRNNQHYEYRSSVKSSSHETETPGPELL